jgi:ribosomal protein S18 acetylase RimI-like enzyme
VAEAVAARHADIARLLGWMQQLYATDHIEYDAARARQALEQLIDDSSLGQALLLLDHGEAVGYLILTLGFSLEFGGREAFIDELFVAAEHRGQGIGRQALSLAADAARAMGARALLLEVDQHNERALGLYRSSGFVEHDRHLMSWRLT